MVSGTAITVPTEGWTVADLEGTDPELDERIGDSLERF